jgi:hypothetical protein
VRSVIAKLCEIKLFERGSPVQPVIDIIEANCRLPQYAAARYASDVA